MPIAVKYEMYANTVVSNHFHSVKILLFSLFVTVSIIKGKRSAFMYIFLISDR